MADQSVRGRFVWHELVTPDSNAAHAFYGKAIGWQRQPWEEDASYVMFAAPRGPVGAAVAGNGSAPHWLPYIGTDDIDATIELAKQEGGSVVKEVASLSSGSRYAVLQDPYGAKFGVYESADEYGKITPPQPGEHSWHELMSTDHDGAFEFYAALFGWQKVAEHDMGAMGTYLIYGVGDVPFGGMMTMQTESGPSWLSYVHVKDVNQTAKKVKSAGGQVVNGPMEVPGGDWIVQAVDPQGAMFAAHATAANMKKAEKKPKKAARKTEQKAAASNPEQLSLAETPAPVQEPETPADEGTPPADRPAEAPAQKAPAKKSPARKAPAREEPPASDTPAEEAPAKRAPARKSPAKKAPAKKGPVKKAPARKSSGTPARKKAGKKAGKKSSQKSSQKSSKKTSKQSSRKTSNKRPAAKRAGSKKTAARKGAARTTGARAKSKTRSGGNKKAVKKPRKGK